jgi:hypothetical protein
VSTSPSGVRHDRRFTLRQSCGHIAATVDRPHIIVARRCVGSSLGMTKSISSSLSGRSHATARSSMPPVAVQDGHPDFVQQAVFVDRRRDRPRTSARAEVVDLAVVAEHVGELVLSLLDVPVVGRIAVDGFDQLPGGVSERSARSTALRSFGPMRDADA